MHRRQTVRGPLLDQDSTQYRTKRFREFHVHCRVLKKCRRAPGSLVNDLIGDDQIARLELLAKTAASPRCDDVRATKLLERENVGPKWNIHRRDQVPRPMPAQKQHRQAL